ncbi:MAG: TetR/AcrR family transcriptional regulator [Myxococcota bacterium]
MNAPRKGKPARERLLEVGASLFSERGFKGVSVREICKNAATSINMVHHYFGSKEGLLDAILERFDARVFATPMRVIAKPPSSREDFVSRLTLLFETTLDAYIEEREVIVLAVREQADLPAAQAYQSRFAEFIDEGKRLHFVRQEIDSEMISGAMLDRILNQVQFAPWIKRMSGRDILSDTDYRERWCRSNFDMFCHGFLPPPAGSN